LKNPLLERAGGVAEGVHPEFKSQYHKKMSLVGLNSLLLIIYLVKRLRMRFR
jgi:hypothetical protein